MIVFHDNALTIKGRLTQDTVVDVLKQSVALLLKAPINTVIKVDVSTVSHCDSACLAFATALLREGKKRKLTVQWIGLPQQMSDLAKLSGIDSMLL